jgi:hypothetical protein
MPEGGRAIDQVMSKLDAVKAAVDAMEQRIGGGPPPMAAMGAPGGGGAGAGAPPIPGDDGELTLKHEGQKGEGGEGGGSPPPGGPPGGSPTPPPVQGAPQAPPMMDSRTDSRRKDTKRKDDDDDDDDRRDSKRKDAKRSDEGDVNENKDRSIGSDSRRKDENELTGGSKNPMKGKGDSKRKDDDDDDDDRRDSKRKDSRRKDDDDDDDDRRDARADEAITVRRGDWDRINRRIDRLASREMMPEEDQMRFADAQSRADSVYGLFGKRAPPFQSGEGYDSYRRRLVTGLRQHSPDWKDVKMSELPVKAFEAAEKAIYADAAVAANNPVDLGEGELRQIVQRDPLTNQTMVLYKGKTSFIKGFSRAGQRVRRVNTFREPLR